MFALSCCTTVRTCSVDLILLYVFYIRVFIDFMAPPFVSSLHSFFVVIKNSSSQKKRQKTFSLRGVFVCFVSKLSDTMEDKDDQYLTDVLSYSAERLAKVNRE